MGNKSGTNTPNVRTADEETELGLELFRTEFNRMWNSANDVYSQSDASSEGWRYLPENIKKHIANNKISDGSPKGTTALSLAKEALEAVEESGHYLDELIAELEDRLED